MNRRSFLRLIPLLLVLVRPGAAQDLDSELGRLMGEILTRGQEVRYLNQLADDIGSRLTGSPQGERAEQAVLSWLQQMGLENVHLEAFPMPARWSRGPAAVRLTSPVDRPLTAASYTWTPGTRAGAAIEGPVVDAGTGGSAEVAAVGSRPKGAIALVSPAGTTLDAVIGNFYRTPELVREVAEAGGLAVLIASDKQRTLLYTAPVSFGGQLSPLPTLSLAGEDVALLRRLLAKSDGVRARVTVDNSLGPSFSAHNVVAEIRGSEKPEEVVLLGAHLDSNDLGPGALDNAAGCAALLETARAIKSVGLRPRRTIRLVFFMGEEEGMLGSTAYVKEHLGEMDQMVAALIMDIGAGKPLGWFSMGRTDLDDELRQLMIRLGPLGAPAIEHAAFAATDNAAFMAAGVPNLVLWQDDGPYVPVHHTAADTPDKADPRDFGTSVANMAGSAYLLAAQPSRFGRRLAAAEVEAMMQATKIEAQWRAARIWPLW